MIIKRPLIYISFLALSVLSVSFVSGNTENRNYSESFPSVVCPQKLSGLNSQVSIASAKVQFQSLENRSSKTVPFKSSRYTLANNSVVINAKSITPVVWQSRTGSWSGGAICTGPATSQWFVGGSANVTSRGHLLVANSGLSDAIIDIATYSENGNQPIKSFTLKSRSSTQIALDALAPGDRLLAIHVTPRSGRINSFLIDEQGAGLKSLGGDFVNAFSAPAQEIFIPAVPNQIISKGQKSSSSHTLRILAPGTVDTTFSAEILTTDGRFIPVELSSRTISAGAVSEFTFAPEIAAKIFSVHITSQEPVVASISTSVASNGHKDFVWSTGVPELTTMSMAISGLTPLFTFTGDSISLRITVTFANGKKVSKQLKGEDLVAWRAPNNSTVISIDSTNKKTYAGAIITSIDGYGFIPVAPGSVLTRVEVPNSNIRVLNP